MINLEDIIGSVNNLEDKVDGNEARLEKIQQSLKELNEKLDAIMIVKI
jgi:peptidoglycan hydrolase CwlO-like protein